MPFDAGAEAADDLPRNRPYGGCDLARVDLLPAFVALTSEQDDFVAGLHVADLGDIHRDHVHRHGADDGHALPADQYVAAPGQPGVETIGVASGNDGDRTRRVRMEPPPVADAFAWTQPLHG